MDRDYIKEFGLVCDVNYKKAWRNSCAPMMYLEELMSEMNEAFESLKVDHVDDVDSNEVYNMCRIMKVMKTYMRKLEVAVNDIAATSKKLFPSDMSDIQKIHDTDPRDWYFSTVNIGDCHDCRLHAGLGNYDKQILPCGAKTCIIAQLCEQAGFKR